MMQREELTSGAQGPFLAGFTRNCRAETVKKKRKTQTKQLYWTQSRLDLETAHTRTSDCVKLTTLDVRVMAFRDLLYTTSVVTDSLCHTVGEYSR